MDCKNCTEYRKKRDAPQVCPWLEERAEAGVVTYAVLAFEFYERWMDGPFGERIRKVLSGKRTVTYYNEGHAARLQVYSTYLTTHWKGGDRNHRLAAMYLMTATEALRRWAMPNLFGLWPTALREWRVLHGLSEQEYAMYAEHSAVYG